MSYYPIQTEREKDGRWIAEIPSLPGVMAYGLTRDEAVRETLIIALRVIADLVEEGKYLVIPGLSFVQVLP